METKICTKCGKEKSLEDFHWRNKAAGTKRSECKECHNNQVKRRYNENKNVINTLKEGKCCVKCGYDKCVAALEYHHTDPTNKVDTVARLSVHYSLEAAMQEIDKCILFCANCHREFHFLEEKEGITLSEFLK